MSAEYDDRLTKYLAGRPIRIDETLRTLPRTANLELAVAAALRLLDHPHSLCACGVPPVRLIRGISEATATHPSHVFLQLAIAGTTPAARTRDAWRRATEALRVLADTTHGFGTAARTDQLAALAREPCVLHAIQGVAANRADVSIPMLVVLAIDGTDASIDALVHTIGGALASGDARLEQLAQVRPFVRPTPALDTLFTELDAAVAVRRSGSPALAFARERGFGRHEVFWCSFLIRSVVAVQPGVPGLQGSVRIDSREDRWFRVELTRLDASPDRTGDRTTWFDDVAGDDPLGIGRCAPGELPAWLRTAATTLRTQWDRFYIRTSLASAKPIEDWLIA